MLEIFAGCPSHEHTFSTFATLGIDITPLPWSSNDICLAAIATKPVELGASLREASERERVAFSFPSTSTVDLHLECSSIHIFTLEQGVLGSYRARNTGLFTVYLNLLVHRCCQREHLLEQHVQHIRVPSRKKPCVEVRLQPENVQKCLLPASPEAI